MANRAGTTSNEEIAALLERAEKHLEMSAYAEAEALANEVLALARENFTLRLEDEARAHCLLGTCCTETGRYDDALSHFGSSLDLAKTVSNLSSQSHAMIGMARVRWYRGDFKTALETAGRALALAEEGEDKNEQALARKEVGDALAGQNDYLSALDSFSHALILAEELGNKMLETALLGTIGTVCFYLADYPSALEHLSRVLALSEESGNRRFAALSLSNIGNVHFKCGDLPQAVDYYARALAIFEVLGDKNGIARELAHIGSAYRHLADYPRALDYQMRSLALFEELGAKRDIASSLCNLGNWYLYTSDYSLALEHYCRARELSEQLGDRRVVADCMYGIAEVQARLGKLEVSYQGHLDTLHYLRDVLGTNERVPLSLLSLGCTLVDMGKPEDAIALLGEGLALAEQLGQKNEASQGHDQLAQVYAILGNPAKELEHLKQHYALQDELLNEESRKKVEAFNFRVATANKERDLKLARQEKELAEAALRLKERDLANTASSLAAQTEMLSNFRADLRKIVIRPDRYEPEAVIKQVREKLKELPCDMIDFAKFESQFATVHPEYRARLEMQYPDLTPQEVKMCMLIHVNLQTAAIARLMCLSERTVEKHRENIRKKLAITNGGDLAEALKRLEK